MCESGEGSGILQAIQRNTNCSDGYQQVGRNCLLVATLCYCRRRVSCHTHSCMQRKGLRIGLDPDFLGCFRCVQRLEGLTHLANTQFDYSHLCADCQACQSAPKLGSCASESTQHWSAAGCKFVEAFSDLCQNTHVTQRIRQYHQRYCAGKCNHNQGCQPW